jgi:hypothetical protein
LHVPDRRRCAHRITCRRAYDRGYKQRPRHAQGPATWEPVGARDNALDRQASNSIQAMQKGVHSALGLLNSVEFQSRARFELRIRALGMVSMGIQPNRVEPAYRSDYLGLAKGTNGITLLWPGVRRARRARVRNAWRLTSWQLVSGQNSRGTQADYDEASCGRPNRAPST